MNGTEGEKRRVTKRKKQTIDTSTVKKNTNAVMEMEWNVSNHSSVEDKCG